MSNTPRTPEGKKRANLNAIRHGLSGQTIENNLLTILATAKAYRSLSQSMDGISKHEARVSRQFDRALKQLGDLQAASLYKLHHELTNEPRSPYDATLDGFVFANEEIETSIGRQQPGWPTRCRVGFSLRRALARLSPLASFTHRIRFIWPELFKCAFNACAQARHRSDADSASW